MNKLLVFFFLSLLNLQCFAKSFTTNASGNWTDASIWNPSYPGTSLGIGDTLIISHHVVLNTNITIGTGAAVIIESSGSLIQSGSRTITMNGSGYLSSEGKITVNSINPSKTATFITTAPVEITGGLNIKNSTSFIFGDSLTVGGQLKIDNTPTVVFGGPLSVGSFEKNSTTALTIDVPMTVAGSFAYNSSSLTIGSNGNVEINGNTSINSDGFTNNGVFVSGGNLSLGASGVINNNGFIDVIGNLSNSGVINSNPVSITRINSTTNTWGTINLDGFLVIENGGTNTGTITGSGYMQVTGTFNNWGTIGGSLDICSADNITPPTINGNSPTGSSTYCQSGSFPLPVSLLSFTAQSTTEYVNIRWITESEINNSHFVLSRSYDGYAFKTIHLAKGMGYSNKSISYEFKDKTAKNGTVYYNLTQVDFDGKTSDLGIIKITHQTTLSNHLISIYPNPSSNWLYISFDNLHHDLFQYQLMDINGRVVSSSTIQSTPFSISLSEIDEIKNGIYFIRVFSESNNFQFQEKIIVLK